MAVDGGASGEDAEGKQTEERAVGVACHEIDEMYDAVAAITNLLDLAIKAV